MRDVLYKAWIWIKFPFIIIIKLLLSPLKLYKKISIFLNTELEENSMPDAIAATIQTPSALIEHVEVLRKHLLRIVLGVVVAIAICFYFTPMIIDLLAEPVGGIANLKAIDVTESIGVYMRIALFSGLVLASPYIAFELWLFAAPGLKPSGRKLGLLGIPLSTILLLIGMLFTFFVIIPSGLPFLLNFMGIETIPRPSSYINFVSGLMFWIGLAFEFPLVIFVLSLMGITKPEALAKQWRIAVVIIAIVAALITPTVDPVNMALVMGPLVILYFMSIGLSYLATINRRRQISKSNTSNIG